MVTIIPKFFVLLGDPYYQESELFHIEEIY